MEKKIKKDKKTKTITRKKINGVLIFLFVFPIKIEGSERMSTC